MKGQLIVDVDTEREGAQILVQGTGKGIDADESLLCEALVNLLHQPGRNRYIALKNCIKHLIKGVDDNSYKVFTQNLDEN